MGSLAEYLACFPGREEEVAREYLRCLNGPNASDDTAPKAPTAVDGPKTVGPYELVRELGRGGQGSVWLARDPRLKREVALKLVPHSPLSGDASRRFEREARAASQLDHPGLCPVYDVGVEEPLAWIAMRYVPGKTLAKELAERDAPPIDLRATTALIEQAARALHAAHEAGVVHRDIKPANVIVTPDGDPVILDFGIARDEGDGAPLTLTGDTLGTPAYMSPEQLEGGRVDRRADVWSLGATAYELFSGVRAFDAPTRAGIVDAVSQREPERPSSHNQAISRDLEVVVQTALSKEVDRRYGSALDLAEDLERIAEGRPIRARRVGATERLWRWARRNPGFAASVATVFVVLTLALFVSTQLLAETRTALDANQLLLSEIEQLADAKVAGDLLADVETLWPVTPEIATALRTWLESARSLEARLPDHREALANVGQRIASEVATKFADTADVDTSAWMQEQLEEIIDAVTELVDVIPRMQARFELADGLERRTLLEPAQEWLEAAERVRADPRFGGFELAPQLGLIPLGPDPASQLEEFAHLPSGTPAQRDPDTRALAIDADNGVVLVLVPGGRSSLGCEPPGAAGALSTGPVDPAAREIDGPIQWIELDPFFISKYELTTGQYVRHTHGVRPSFAVNEKHARAGEEMLHPVEQVNSLTIVKVLEELSLVVPTEAQWEHAARGGTTTIWYTGNEPESLAGHVNLSDKGSRGNGGGASWEYVEWLEDGYTASAPIGRFEPNPFGLHDVCGNVFEWTSSPWLAFHEDPPLDGDGRPGRYQTTARVVRGGSYANPESAGRSCHRDGIPGHLFSPDIGARPARAIDPR